MQPDHPFTVKGFSVWIICALFFLYEFSLRTILGTFQHPIMYDLELSTFKFALISSTMYLAIYGLMQIPVGFIVDRLGLKKSLLIGVIACTVSAIGFAYASNYYIASFWRILMGFGSSFGFICLLISVYDWMPLRYSAIFIGLSQFIGTLGPMMSAGPLHSIADSGDVNWRTVFMILSLCGVVLTLLIFFIVKNNHNKAGIYTILKRPEPISKIIPKILRHKQAWAIALFSACSYFTIEYLAENEGKAFIMSKGHDISFSSYMITLSWVGFAIGCPLLGFLSDFFKNRKIIMVFSGLCCFVSLFLIVFTKDQILQTCAFLLLGIGASGQSIGFAIMAEQFKKKFIAISLSLNNAVIMTIASINAPIIGLTIDNIKTGNLPSHDDYSTVFIILVIIGLGSLIIPLFFIKETFGKSKADLTYLVPTPSK